MKDFWNKLDSLRRYLSDTKVLQAEDSESLISILSKHLPWATSDGKDACCIDHSFYHYKNTVREVLYFLFYR